MVSRTGCVVAACLLVPWLPGAARAGDPPRSPWPSTEVPGPATMTPRPPREVAGTSEEDVPDADPKALLAAKSPLGDITYGKETAPVTVVEYSSMSCAFCAAFHREVFPLVLRRWVDTGKVRWVVREMVTDQVSMAATRMVRCAAPTPRDAGRWEEGLFRRQSDYMRLMGPKAADTMKGLASLGTTLGIDAAKFEACRKDMAVGQALFRQSLEARDRFHVAGTPVFFVDGKAISGNPGMEGFEDALPR